MLQASEVMSVLLCKALANCGGVRMHRPSPAYLARVSSALCKQRTLKQVQDAGSEDAALLPFANGLDAPNISPVVTPLGANQQIIVAAEQMSSNTLCVHLPYIVTRWEANHVKMGRRVHSKATAVHSDAEHCKDNGQINLYFM